MLISCSDLYELFMSTFVTLVTEINSGVRYAPQMLVNGALSNVLAALGEPLLVPATALLFDDNEPCTGAYVILSGAVDVQLLTPDGVPVWSSAVSAGGILGLPNAISLRQHHVRATASADSSMAFVSAAKIMDLIHTDSYLGFMIIEVISEELSALYQRLAMLS